MPSSYSRERFEALPVVGILRGYSADIVEALLPVYYRAGLTTLEITMNTPGAAGILARAAAGWGDRLNVGAGTVCTPADLDAALAAGAAFIVTPAVVPAVIGACRERGVPVFPGAFTPTEVLTAWQFGATAVKVFPASVGGPAYIGALRGPLGHIPLLPTGGVDRANLAAYFAAGAAGVGMGSPLFPAALMRARDGEGLERHLRAVAEEVRRALENKTA